MNQAVALFVADRAPFGCHHPFFEDEHILVEGHCYSEIYDTFGFTYLTFLSIHKNLEAIVC